jgi:hypothetical protein
VLRTNAPQQAGQQNADNFLAAFVNCHGLGINGIGHGMAPGQKNSLLLFVTYAIMMG